MRTRGGKRLIGVGMAALLLPAFALAMPAAAMAGCPECDQYTLVIPDPGGGHPDPGNNPAPAPEPAPAPAPAPVAAAPAPTAVAPVTETTQPAKPRRRRPVPTMEDAHVRATPPEAAPLSSTPLAFDRVGTGDALLAGLDPATLALLTGMALIGLVGRAGRRGVGG